MSLHSQGASRGTATLFGVPKGGRILWVMPGLGFGDILAQLRWELGEQGCCEQVEKLPGALSATPNASSGGDKGHTVTVVSLWSFLLLLTLTA